MNKIIFALILLSQIPAFTGCAKLMAGLRRDLDDGDVYSSTPPTSGGRWAERGMLNDGTDGNDQGMSNSYEPETYAAVGHSERGPASYSGDPQAPGAEESWVGGNPEQVEANQRDHYRSSSSDEEAGPSRASLEQRPTRRNFKNGSRATRADFIDSSTNEGSLWAPEGQTNFYFSKNKVRGIGDIITITMDQDIIRDLSLEVKRSLTPRERDTELAIAQEKLRAQLTTNSAPGVSKADNAPAANQNAPASDKKADSSNPEEPQVREANMSDVDLSTELEIKANDTMMAEVVERYPNGNYKIRGTKKVIYKNGAPRLVTVVAVARGQDITDEDVVNSGKLYEYRLEAAR